MSTSPLLRDRFGRQAEKLRISVTDRCNFRCTYCMPVEGLDWLRREDLLQRDEIRRLASIFTGLGITQLRLTGGEPLLRPDLPEIVADLAALPQAPALAITTNGVLLPQLAPKLYAAGLKSYNVSLDSLQTGRFAQSTRREALAQVWAGLKTLGQWPDVRVKLNVVVMRGVNDDEAVDFARVAREHNWAVRFIEFMPLGQDDHWSGGVVVPGQELLDQIQAVYPLEQQEAAGRNPATRWRFADGAPGEIGFINAVTEPFCHSCNRIRLTADGQLRTCLFSLHETDLRGQLRSGASDAQLTETLHAAIAAKEAGHLIQQIGFERPARTMSRIGG